MKIRNVLSLFDGMSCGQIALIENKIPFGTYYASEIDKHAIYQTQINFPNTVQLGDVNNWLLWDIDWTKIDLILAGSPCQGFSFAGAQLAFDDPRSSLFFTFVDILRYAQRGNPNVRFLLENVRMKKEHLNVITGIVKVSPLYIDSALVSAQTRKRYYWTDISNSIPQPEDRNILLGDILSSNVSSDYDIDISRWVRSKDRVLANTRTKNEKAHTLLASSYKGAGSNGHTNILECEGVAIRGRYQYDGSTKQQIEFNGMEKSNALTTVEKDALIRKGCRIRRITEIECSRLQNVPAWYVWDCSRVQQRKMLGNGWNIATIRHILKYA